MKDNFPRRRSVMLDRRRDTTVYSLATARVWTWQFSVVIVGILLLVCPLAPGTKISASENTPPETVLLQHSDLTESSGVAVSHRRRDRIWSHNDSGDQARLFAFDTNGRSTGVWQLPTGKAVDWEDMASFKIDGRPRLLVADTGDNDARRSTVQLYLLDEPDPDKSGVVENVEVLSVRFPDGPCDCEAVAVDTKTQQIWLATKRRLPVCELLVIPLPLQPKSSLETVTARHVASVAIPMVTAMDITDDANSLVLCGYWDAFVFRCPISGSGTPSPMVAWQNAFREIPQHLTLPPLKQIEAICFAQQNQLWVTSEGVPAPLMKLEIPNPKKIREPR